MNRILYGLFAFCIASIVVACSTERNSLLSRTYHGTTAHYNGYFNANDLLNQALTTYRTGLKEDYYAVLPIRPLPSEEEVKNLYTPIDTAISKCTKVIQRHAMPSNDKPSAKKNEYNAWIDENWTTIGVANYYRRDYDQALKSFEYVKRFFGNDKSTYIAEMWQARTFIQQGKLTEANFAITNLEKAKEEAEEGESSKKNKSESKSKKKKKSKKKEEKKDPFPKKLRFDLSLTKALFAEKKNDKDELILALTEALEFAKKSADKARINFILAQLHEEKGNRSLATECYNQVLKSNAGYEMSFNARLKRALTGSGPKVKQDLNKLLRDTKNAEFKDQIYYTLALISLQENEENKALEQFTQSAFYSTSNNRQKGMSYEKLGDIYFVKKDYLKAQKYYDSCGKVVPETYPNYLGVKAKASKLQNLVTAIETAQLEDSLQKLATMSEGDRIDFAEKLIAKLKADEKRQKEIDAERLLALQSQIKPDQNASGSKWYWNNEKAKKEGFEEFKRQWGQRSNEDDWRRSEKISFADATNAVDDTLGPDKTANTSASSLDSLTPEQLLANVPLSDSSLALSRERMMSAYFDAGKIYQDQLNENALAEVQYEIILSKTFASNYKLLSSYQIYRMYASTDSKAIAQRDYILTQYPISDYAGYLRDPDYFIKKKEREKETELEYLTDLDRYERGLYYPVITKANLVITEQKDNPFIAKYYLLKAKAQAKLNDDKTTLLPTLTDLIALYPGTPEAKKGAEMKRIIENGYSRNEAVDFTSKSIYTYTENEPLFMLIFLKEKVNGNVAKTRVVDFNKEFFGKLKLNTSSKLLDKETVILLKEFTNEEDAAKYVSTYKKTKKHLLDMQNFKILYISAPNLKTLFETFKLADYELFFDENY